MFVENALFIESDFFAEVMGIVEQGTRIAMQSDMKVFFCAIGTVLNRRPRKKWIQTPFPNLYLVADHPKSGQAF